jgi:hypothetical protein
MAGNQNLLSAGGAKRYFFDRLKVTAAADKAMIRVLSRFGAYVRTRSRSSLRRRKAASPPGSPPSVHSSSKFTTLRNILFVYDPATRSVVTGPVLLRNRNRRGGPPATQLQEMGGSVEAAGRVVRVKNHVGRDAKGRYVSGGTALVKLNGSLKYPARPFMRPAFEAELGGRLRSQLRGMIGRAT